VDAFLLKETSQEFEFTHRLLRDYFALRELRPSINSPHRERRLETIHTLGYQGESALDVLVELAGQSDPSVRAAALSGISHISSPIATECFRQHVNDAVPEVRRAFIRGMYNLPYDHVKKFSKAMRPVGDGCEVDPFLDALKRDDYWVWSTTDQIARLGAAAVGPLLERVEDRRERVREVVVEALGRLGDQRAVPPLLARLLDKREHSVAVTAAESLGQLGDPRAFKPLLEKLGDRRERVAAAAANALGLLKDSRGLDPLLEKLGDSRELVAAAAANALGLLKDSRALDPLLACLRDKSAIVAEAAAKALGVLGDSRAVGPLIEKLADPSESVAAAVAEALGSVGDRRAIGPLRQCLEHPSGIVRLRAHNSISFIRTRERF
jgi:HEAT repeat protein